MVAYYLNCLLCGCGWGPSYGVPTDLDLLKRYFSLEDFNVEFPENVISNAVYDGKIDADIAKKLKSSFKELPAHSWMNNVIAVLPNKIDDVELEMEDSYYVRSKASGEEYHFYDFDITMNTYKNKAYIMHRDCYTLLKNKGYDVSYGSLAAIDDIKPKKKHITKPKISNNRFDMNYGLADKYIGEYGIFYEHYVYMFDSYLLESPLANNKNADRILNFKFPLKMSN